MLNHSKVPILIPSPWKSQGSFLNLHYAMLCLTKKHCAAFFSRSERKSGKQVVSVRSWSAIIHFSILLSSMQRSPEQTSSAVRFIRSVRSTPQHWRDWHSDKRYYPVLSRRP